MHDQLNIQLRPGRESDLSAMQELFVDTVMKSCRNDYSKRQLKVWAAAAKNDERWRKKMASQYFLVAELEGKIVGFGSLAEGDYLDFLYVHKDYLRRGIASRLFEALEVEAGRLGKKILATDASITARPFFETKGFEVVKGNRNLIEGVEIVNYMMERRM